MYLIVTVIKERKVQVDWVSLYRFNDGACKIGSIRKQRKNKLGGPAECCGMSDRALGGTWASSC